MQADTDTSLIGGTVEDVPTPALVVDIEALERNLAAMAGYFTGRTCSVRPHFKSHKCVELARRQLAAGNAPGITCAKVSEAEVLVAGGITDVLIANQVVGVGKAHRLAAMNAEATVRCAIDAPEQLAELGAAAVQAGVTIPVLVEVDVGMQRCGVPPGGAAVSLARAAAATPGLRFDGLQGYEGHVVCLPDAEERAARTREALRPLVETRRTLEGAGVAVRIVSSGGTGTYDTTGNIEGIDEVQCGSYALMDASYKRVRPEFEVARCVLATVISAHDGYAVIDVGVKGLGCEFGPPVAQGWPQAVARYTAEEHVPFDNLSAHVGEKLRLVPSHGCTTNNLYRSMWISRRDTVEDVWPIEGSGCLE